MALQGHIVIPTTHDMAEAVVSDVRAKLAVALGGYSEYEGSGGWDGEDGLVTEDHVRLVADNSPDSGLTEDQFREMFRIEAEYVKDVLDEEAVLIEFREIEMELV